MKLVKRAGLRKTILSGANHASQENGWGRPCSWNHGLDYLSSQFPRVRKSSEDSAFAEDNGNQRFRVKRGTCEGDHRPVRLRYP